MAARCEPGLWTFVHCMVVGLIRRAHSSAELMILHERALPGPCQWLCHKRRDTSQEAAVFKNGGGGVLLADPSHMSMRQDKPAPQGQKVLS